MIIVNALAAFDLIGLFVAVVADKLCYSYCVDYAGGGCDNHYSYRSVFCSCVSPQYFFAFTIREQY